MRFLRRSLPLLLVMAFAAGCVTTKTVRLYARTIDNGTGIEILKDDKHHELAIVKPGQRIKWVCANCPRGAEFAVEGLYFVGYLDALLDRLTTTRVTDPQRLTGLIEWADSAGMSEPQRVEGVIEVLESIRQGGQVDRPREGTPSAALQAGAPSVGEQPVDDAIGMLRALQSAFSPREGPESGTPVESGERGEDKEPTLFQRKWSPSGFKASGRSIKSPRVGEMTGLEVWKFTWRVRLQGAGEDSWDPHIIGHPGF